MALAIFAFLLVVCNADSHPDYEPPYGEKLHPKSFNYEYGLESSSSGAAFSKKESQDDKGNIIGEVVVSLPDGRIQTTNYNADFYKGYNADVKYVGTPKYPKEQYEKYNGPQFIPVHLEPKPDTLFAQENRERNSYKTRTSPSGPGFKILPHRKKLTLQPELKSIESAGIQIGESLRTQKIKFESEKLNSLNNKDDLNLPETLSEKFESESESLSEIMEKAREDLKNIPNIKESSVNIPQTNANTVSIVQKKEALQNKPPSTSKPDKMLEIMKRIRDNVKHNNDAITPTIPSLNPETPPPMVIKSHVMSEPNDKMVEIMKQKRTNLQKTEKLKIGPATTEKQNFQERPLSSGRPDKAEDIVKNREDLKDNAYFKILKLPSLNPETPPLMIIKSHVISRPDHVQTELLKKEPNVPEIDDKNSNIKRPMSIKSHVISAPEPAESMEEIMKKIREDLEDREQSNNVEIPAVVENLKQSNSVLLPLANLKLKSNEPSLMAIKSHVHQAPEAMQVMSHVIKNKTLSKLSTVKPLQDRVVDFMKKVELMKESEKKPKNTIMSVKSRVIPESSILQAVPSKEESTNHVRY